METIQIKQEFDRAIGHAQKKDVILIGAPILGGKTAFKTWIGANATIQGHNSLFLTIETSPEKIIDWSEKAVHKQKRKGSFMIRQLDLNEGNFISRICNSLEACKKNNTYPDILIIDNIDLLIMRMLEKTLNKKDNLRNIIVQLKEMAIEYNVLLVTSMQLARDIFGDVNDNIITYDKFGFDKEMSACIDKFIIIKTFKKYESRMVSAEHYNNFNIDIIKRGENLFFKRLKANYNFSNNYIDFFEDFYEVDQFFVGLSIKMKTLGTLVFHERSVCDIFTAYFTNSLLNMKKNVLYCTPGEKNHILAVVSSSDNHNYKHTGKLYIHQYEKIENEVEKLIKNSDGLDYIIVDGLEEIKTFDAQAVGILRGIAVKYGIGIIITSLTRRIDKKRVDVQISDVSQTYHKVSVADYVMAISNYWPSSWAIRLFMSKTIYGAKVIKDRWSSDGFYYKLKIDKDTKKVKYLNKRKAATKRTKKRK